MPSLVKTDGRTSKLPAEPDSTSARGLDLSPAYPLPEALIYFHLIKGNDSLHSRAVSLSCDGGSMPVGRAKKKSFQPAKDNLWIQNALISRNHALLSVRGIPLQVFLTDNKSRHGTFRNTFNISGKGECELSSGDKIQFGDKVVQGNASFEPIVFRVWFTMPQLSRQSVAMIKRSRNYSAIPRKRRKSTPEAPQLEDFLEGLAKQPFLGTSFEHWLIREKNSGVLQHVAFEYEGLPDYAKPAIENNVRRFQQQPPDNPRYNIRFVKAPVPGWIDDDAPVDNNVKSVSSYQQNGFLVLEVTPDGTEILERGDITGKLTELKESIHDRR